MRFKITWDVKVISSVVAVVLYMKGHWLWATVLLLTVASMGFKREE